MQKQPTTATHSTGTNMPTATSQLYSVPASEAETMMPIYPYKCMKCQERHERRVANEEFESTYHAACPFCGWIARRVPTLPEVHGHARRARQPELQLQGG